MFMLQGSLMTGMKLPNLAGRGERLQADYTYGTKKSSSFNIGIFKPLRGIFRSNLSGAVLFEVPFEPLWCSFN